MKIEYSLLTLMGLIVTYHLYMTLYCSWYFIFIAALFLFCTFYIYQHQAWARALSITLLSIQLFSLVLLPILLYLVVPEEVKVKALEAARGEARLLKDLIPSIIITLAAICLLFTNTIKSKFIKNA